MCDGVHPLKKFPNTTNKRKKGIFDDHYKEKQQKNLKNVKTNKDTQDVSRSVENGRFRIDI